MQLVHNWFSRLSYIILSGALLYLYQFMLRSQAAVFTEIFGVPVSLGLLAVLLVLISGFLFGVYRLRKKQFHFSSKAENWIAGSILIVGFILRIVYAKYMVLEPASDFLRYHSIAEHLVNGTLQTTGSAHCDYIALFPGTIGTSVYLAMIYRLFGSGNLFAAQAVNAVLAVFSCFFIWRTARQMGGKGTGLAALFLTAFCPSQILFANGLASEFPFVFLMTLCIWLFVLMLERIKSQCFKGCIVLSVLIGILTGVNQNIRSTSGIFLIACLICLFSLRPIRPEPKTRKRVFSFLLAVLMTVSFILTGSVCNSAIEKTIDQKVTKGVKKVGWNLFLGMNRESVGKYNSEDVQLWDEARKGKTPDEAHAICFDAAIERAFSDFASLPKLLVGKYEVLWGDDVFSCDYNIIQKGEQGTLTEAADAFLRSMRLVCSVYYFMMLAFSGLYVWFAWKKRRLDGGYLLVLIWLGTIAAHLLLETAPRYHYHVLNLMPVLCALGISQLWQNQNTESLQK